MRAIVIENVLIGKHAAIEIAGEILQGLCPLSGFLTLDHPFFGRDAGMESGFIQGMKQGTAKGPGQCAAVEQILAL